MLSFDLYITHSLLLCRQSVFIILFIVDDATNEAVEYKIRMEDKLEIILKPYESFVCANDSNTVRVVFRFGARVVKDYHTPAEWYMRNHDRLTAHRVSQQEVEQQARKQEAWAKKVEKLTGDYGVSHPDKNKFVVQDRDDVEGSVYMKCAAPKCGKWFAVSGGWKGRTFVPNRGNMDRHWELCHSVDGMLRRVSSSSCTTLI